MPANKVQRARHARFWDLIRVGNSAGIACEAVGVHRSQGYRWIKAAGGRIPLPEKPRSGRYLGQDERLMIADLRRGGASVRAIARELGRAPSTVCRELRRNGLAKPGAYGPFAAQKRSDLRARRPKLGKLEDPILVAAVEERLVKNWSPRRSATTSLECSPVERGDASVPRNDLSISVRPGSGSTAR